jgi:hypothetical protein
VSVANPRRDDRLPELGSASGDGAVVIASDNTGAITTFSRSGIERLDDVIFDVTGLEADLGLGRYTGREWVSSEFDRFVR